MPHAVATVELPVNIDTLWHEIGSFQGIGEWHPMLESVEGVGEAPVAVRTAMTADGSQQVERLQHADPSRHRYSYVIESTAMPVVDYRAELRAHPLGSSSTRVRWAADFEVSSGDEAQVVELVQGFFDTGLASLRERHP